MDATARSRRRASWALVGVALALAASTVLYRWLVGQQLEQTSALFIGVPTALAIFTALLPPAKNAYSVTLRTMTLALLLSGIVLGEGFVCILFAAPLFYLVGLIVTGAVLAVRRGRRRRPQVLGCLALAPLVLSVVEGTHPRLSMERSERVTAERIVAAPVGAVEAALAGVADFDRLPLALRIGFPRPVRSEGSGLAVGDRRTVYFAGGEGPPGELVVEVRERGLGRVVFGFPRDRSHIAHWLRWRRAEVSWRAVGGGEGDRTRVRWTLHYERRLDPAWYFGPIERGFVRLTAGHLIEVFAQSAGPEAPRAQRGGVKRSRAKSHSPGQGVRFPPPPGGRTWARSDQDAD